MKNMKFRIEQDNFGRLYVQAYCVKCGSDVDHPDAKLNAKVHTEEECNINLIKKIHVP